eukprot:3941613-Rhodomonas_salina.8
MTRGPAASSTGERLCMDAEASVRSVWSTCPPSGACTAQPPRCELPSRKRMGSSHSPQLTALEPPDSPLPWSVPPRESSARPSWPWKTRDMKSATTSWARETPCPVL